MTLTKALMEHCKLPGESTSQFAAQLRALTPEDKAWFRTAFEQQGITIETLTKTE